MATKTLSIKEEAYQRLKSFKKKDQSFSDVIMDLTGYEKDFSKGFGAWKGDTEEFREAVEEGREKLDRDLRDREDDLSRD